MKKAVSRRTTLLFAGLILGSILAQSCAPKIYGQTKRKRISNRDCGCELRQDLKAEGEHYQETLVIQ